LTGEPADDGLAGESAVAQCPEPWQQIESL
jgi:hypothetical protein